MPHDDSQLKRSLRRGVRHLLGVPEEESLQAYVEVRSAHLRRRGERAFRSFERVLQGLGIAPSATTTAAVDTPAHVERPEPTKFDLGQGVAPAPPEEHIPWGYGRDRVTAMPVDPEQLYVYWEVTDDSIAAARRGLGAAGAGAWLNLRVYDVTGRIFDGTNAHAYFDHRVERHERQWFFAIGKPGSTACVELGMKSVEGYFVRLARSARTEFPRAQPVPPGEVEWLSVRNASGDLEQSYTAPRPLTGTAPAVDVRRSAAAAAAAGPGASGNGTQSPFSPTRSGAERTTHSEEWRESAPGAWQEVRRSAEWVGDVEHSSWEAGPFEHPVEAPSCEVSQSHGESVTVTECELGTRVVEGPWEVTIRGIGGYVRRRVLGRWEIARTVPAEAASADVESLEQDPLGGSDRVARTGASDLRLAFGSELRLAGASEEFLVGASELRYRGASERIYAGASERRLLGASERLGAGAGQWAYAGASERVHGSASELRLGGASEIVHSARVSWQAFADEGARLAAAAPTVPDAAPFVPGASEERLQARVPAVERRDGEQAAAPTERPLPPRW